ncbi:MAG: hypothetical protein PVH61_33235 [Candidatus Aminicenantes bacterium]|jgi:hypothetical protein
MDIDEKKPTSMVLVIVALVITLGLMGYFLFFAGEGNSNSSDQIRQMQELTHRVQGMESDVKAKESEIFRLVMEYREKTGETEPLGFNPTDLGEEAQALLKQRIKEEKDVSIKSLLEDILDKKEEIQELKEKIAAIENLLPAPHIVTKGENHYRIALDFLVNEKGVEKEEAIELVNQTALFDELMEGFKVWNFYTGDEYGTSVTQGTATISPNMLIHLAKKKITDARDQAVSQRDKLAGDIKVLEEKQEQVITQVNLLAKEKENLITKVTGLNQQANSLFYLLDLQKNLEKKGILKSGFLKTTKLRDVSPEHFCQAIDLRSEDQVLISAANLGIKKIKDVTLFPKFYKQGSNYRVKITADNRFALLTIVDREKFRNERVVIAVKPLRENRRKQLWLAKNFPKKN